MGRPEEPLERDGTPVAEFAFWLRDLRRGSGLTYQSLARATHYATSTMQAAAAGQHLPTLKVTLAFVAACGGDQEAWRAYWTLVRRALDGPGPGPGQGPSTGVLIRPPSAAAESPAVPGPADPPEPAGQPAVDALAAPNGWYVESFSALVRMDKTPPEAVEHRVIVAVAEGISELATAISVPRHPDDEAAAHQIEAELQYGGSLELREQPYESYFRHVIALSRNLEVGERHEYQMLLRVPADQQMAPHYVYIPFCRSDRFELHARFSQDKLPARIWMLPGVPPAVIYERRTDEATVLPDRFGEVHLEFTDLQIGLGYGLCWEE